MSGTGSVARAIEVGVDPATAFEVFTAEVDTWYPRGPYSFNNPERAVAIRFEPGVGGRWFEVWDEETGEGFEIGRITVWEPGARLVLDYRNLRLPPEPLTEVEVRFEPIEDGTRVTLEHRGFEKLPPEAVANFVSPRAWRLLMQTFRDYVSAGSRARSTDRR